MPLIKSASKKAVGKNIETEMGAGKPQAQSIAIALGVQRKNKKKMAMGGKAEADHSPNLEIIDERYPAPDKKDFMSKDWSGGSAPARKPDDMRLPMAEYMASRFAKGGVAEAIMRKKMMAEGGEVDLAENAEEHDNETDDLNLDALGKENYSESAGLDDLDYDTSVSKGDMLSDEDAHDMISAIRRRMKSKA